MSGLKTSSALAVALATFLAPLSAESAIRVTHRHHAPLLRPAVGVGPGYDFYPSTSNGDYGAAYGGGTGLSEGFTRNSGGVNSMSNDFGTSGVLGHTNGLPIVGH